MEVTAKCIHFAVALLLINGLVFIATANETVKEIGRLKIKSREDWRAREPKEDPDLSLFTYYYVLITETGTEVCNTTKDCKEDTRAIQLCDMRSKSVNDIKAHFLIGGDGTIYEGRKIDRVIEMDGVFDYYSYLIVSFFGSFDRDEPTTEQLESAKRLIKNVVDTKRLSAKYMLTTLKSVTPNGDSDNPGKNLYDVIKTWPGWPAGLGPTPFKIVKRSEWKAKPPKQSASKLQILPPPYVIISHTVTGSCTTQSQCIYLVRAIQSHHKGYKNWDDIGYNFLIGGDGLVYEGRGWDVAGNHSGSNFNFKSIGVSFIGDFTNKHPTEAQLRAAQNLLDFGVINGKLSRDYKLLGHRQCRPTKSPGEVLYNIIKTWSHWAPKP